MEAHPQPTRLAGVAALAERYGVFFLDQFGVLHDGTAPYPGAVEALAKLRQAGKRIVVLSNSGKRAAPNEQRLARLGFTPGSWDHFLTSGEVAWQILVGTGKTHRLAAGAKCLLISRDGDRSPVDGLGLQLVEDGRDAEVVLLAASEGDRFELEHYRAMLEPAARLGIECYCTNPDKIMLTAVGMRFGAGRIAELYEEMGGPVTWIGKPFPQIYRAALALCGDPEAGEVVCVGDSVEHDIAGGQGAGLSTALVMAGILAGSSEADLAGLFEQYGARPDYLLPAFGW